MTIKAYAYIRFSDPSQSTGNSVARQTEMAVNYGAKNGIELDWSYRDEGLSAFHGLNRLVGGLGRFMADVQTGKVVKGSHLLIENFDRFSREDPMEALYAFLTILRSGIVLVTLTDNQVWSTESLYGSSHRLFGVLPTMDRAHGESKRKSVNTLDNWERRRAKGVVVDRLTKPAWLDVVDGEYKVNPVRGPIVVRIFEEIASGVGADSVARRLNEDGRAAWGPKYKDTGTRAGKTRIWHGSYIQTLINGRQVIGEHQHHQYDANRKRVPIGDPVPNYFPPAVPRDLYHRAKAAFQSRSLGGGRKSTKLVNIFGDLAICAHCGGRMRWNGATSRTRDKKPFVYLICSSNIQRIGCDHSERHRLEYIETAVLDLVVEIRLDGIADDSEAKAVLAEAIHQRRAAEDRVGKIAELLIELDSPTMRTKFAEAEKALIPARQAVEAAEQAVALVRNRIAPSNQQKAIADIRATMATDHNVTHRIRLQGAIRGVVDRIAFKRDGGVIITLMGGKRVYRFKIDKEVKMFEMDSGNVIMTGGFVRTAADFEAFKEAQNIAA